jgi:Spy/CpxP family protein refolding chaperone
MVRISHSTMVPAVAGVAMLCICGAAQAQAGGARGYGQGQYGQGSRMYLPGYYSLASESVQKELNITEKQKAKLEEISKTYRESYRRQTAEEWKNLTREERTKKYAEMTEARRKRTADFTKQVEDVLTRRQLDELKMVELRRRGVYYLTNSRTAEKLGLSEEQVEKLQKNRNDLREATARLQRESAKKALGILLPEQLEQLKQMQAEGFRSIWRQPQQPKQ